MASAPSTVLVADFQQAVAQHRAGRLGAAEQLYRRVLAVQPRHAQASHNLGVILAQDGRGAAGLELLRTAVAQDGVSSLFWTSCIRTELSLGLTVEAAASLERARAQGVTSAALDALETELARRAALDRAPGLAQAIAQADALAAGDQVEAAIEAYRQVFAIDPDCAEAHYRLGSLLAADGRIAEGFAHLQRRAEIIRGADDLSVGRVTAAPHKRKHDAEQREYLIDQGLLDPDAPANAFVLGDGARVAGPAIERRHARPALFEQWRAAAPQQVVIDDFLTAPALRKLQDYCATSTIWRRVYDAGYIGATPHDGLACPLMAQIAEEIRETYAAILEEHPFQYLGAFKYDSELSTGTNTHADYSAVNVNLYVTPDRANLDPESGGMVLWDVAASDETEMRRFNSDEPALQAHLQRAGRPPLRIAHRTNRAVIFRSSLYHRTDDCRFREGYLNKRINVSLLYGRWAGG